MVQISEYQPGLPGSARVPIWKLLVNLVLAPYDFDETYRQPRFG